MTLFWNSKVALASNDYNINISIQDDGTTTVNATILVCDDETQTSLETEFADNLQTDFIDKTLSVAVEVDSTTIQTEVSGFTIDGATDIITTTRNLVDPANGDTEDGSSYIIIAAIGGGFVFLLLVAIGFIYLAKKNRKLKQQLETMKAAEGDTRNHNNTLTVTDMESADAHTVRSIDTVSAFAETPGNLLRIESINGVVSGSEDIGESGDEGTSEIQPQYLDDEEDDEDLWRQNVSNVAMTPMGVTDSGSAGNNATLR